MKNIDFDILRENMVSGQIFKRGLNDPKILEAFRNIPRHLFVPPNQRNFAYQDCPLPIGEGQTISQPYMVALMTKILEISPKMRILEVGTGSGYQAAILAYLEAEVYSIERIPTLVEKAKEVINSLGYKVEIKVGDGTLGWPQYAPYDRIIVTAATAKIPPALIEQTKIKGKIVLPLGQRFRQVLTVIHKISQHKIRKESICGCIFVPLVGEHGYKE